MFFFLLFFLHFLGFSSYFNPAARVDSSDDPLAREPNPGENRERPAGQTGGLQRLPHSSQTTQGPAASSVFTRSALKVWPTWRCLYWTIWSRFRSRKSVSWRSASTLCRPNWDWATDLPSCRQKDAWCPYVNLHVNKLFYLYANP